MWATRWLTTAPTTFSLAPSITLGSSFTLQHWELRDSIQVQRCQRVYLESWWQMAEQPQHNYSLLIALVNTDGQAVSPLTTVPTKVWIPDAYFLDARSLQVPCDAPAGEYPLVMSIYNPDTVAAQGSLPVTLPDGSPFNDYVYLTTLHVND
ncbi:MAG: hypothetical protein K8J31_02875 [Anaerolineae bacterium]|nr:hypothetical protein [Anaerolineae bacterium]